MQDERVIKDLKATYSGWDGIETLQANGITRYSQLFDLIRDEKADEQLRSKGCGAVDFLYKTVDKRRALPSLLVALHSSNDDVKRTAIMALGRLGTRKGTDTLFELASDVTYPPEWRALIINSLWGANLPAKALSHLREIMLNPDEDGMVRAQAIESSHYQPIENPLEAYQILLKDQLPDARFWAAYCLSQFVEDITATLEDLDRVAAYDHTLPQTWGWHVDREALLPLETIYQNLLFGPEISDDGEHHRRHTSMYLISPAPEYWTLDWRYRRRGADGTYITDPLPEIKLRVDPARLAEQMQTQWPEMAFNVRQPKPQTYVLDWHWQKVEDHMIGGLHRDGYGVVLSGNQKMVIAFAAWYRGLFPKEQHLYLYIWAEEHIELKVGMDEQAIEKVLYSSHKRRYKDIMKEKLVFG